MNMTLTVDDSLAEQAVGIVITLVASEQPRDERPVLVSVGTAGNLPVIKTGTFGQVPALINAAWTALSVQAQLAAQSAGRETEMLGTELVGEEQVASQPAVAVRAVGAGGERRPASQPKPVTSQSPAKNLSLF